MRKNGLIKATPKERLIARYYGDDIRSEQFDRGLLYNWYSVADERGVCPSGFHVSSETDWDVLESFLGSNDADPIRAQESWYENYTPNGSNSAGLSVMSQHAMIHQNGNNNSLFTYTNSNGLYFGPEPLSGPAVRPVHQVRFLQRSLNPSVLRVTTRNMALTFAASKTCRAAWTRMAAITMQDSISTTVRAITLATNGWPRMAPVHAREQRA